MTIPTAIIILGSFCVLIFAFYEVLIRDRGRYSLASKWSAEDVSGPVDVFTQAHVTAEREVIYSEPIVKPGEGVMPELARYVKNDIIDKGLAMSSVIREHSKATINLYTELECFKAVFREKYVVFNKGVEPHRYWLWRMHHYNPELSIPERSIMQSFQKYEREFKVGLHRSEIYSWHCNRIKIKAEGETSLEFKSTDVEMYKHIRHFGDHWILNYPIVLEPKQNAAIEIDMLIWASLKDIKNVENLGRFENKGFDKAWLPFISTFRNFEARGTFEYEIIKQPKAVVNVAGIEVDPPRADYRQEEKVGPDESYSWFILFPKVIIPRMGLRLRLGVG